MTQLLEAELFGEQYRGVYAILDGASVKDLRMKLFEEEPEHECLFPGDLEPDMEEVAAHLVRLEKGTPFTDWVLQKGWGKHWGVFVFGPPDLPVLRQHLRCLLIVHDSAGNPMRFRYYDPRVLRIFLPTCTGEELGVFFGPVTRYLMEGEKPDSILNFQFAGGALQQQEKRG
ncbi:MAG: DUF4123 domain-containing protein [Acidobacteriia bacterium]|nr:DUF4123 domain-containing protein [Terriglobia bacterium]